MSKKLIWPVAQRRKDGTPAIWLTHSNWMVIKDCLIRKYCDGRKEMGEHRARTELKVPDAMVDSFLWQYCEHSSRDCALEMYVAGAAAYVGTKQIEEHHYLTPAALVALGDKIEADAYAAELRLRIQQKELKEAA